MICPGRSRMAKFYEEWRDEGKVMVAESVRKNSGMVVSDIMGILRSPLPSILDATKKHAQF